MAGALAHRRREGGLRRSGTAHRRLTLAKEGLPGGDTPPTQAFANVLAKLWLEQGEQRDAVERTLATARAALVVAAR